MYNKLLPGFRFVIVVSNVLVIGTWYVFHSVTSIGLYQMLKSTLDLWRPINQVRWTEFVDENAVKLYGALDGIFSTNTSVSTVIVAALLVAEHWYIPTSSDCTSVIVKFPSLII